MGNNSLHEVGFVCQLCFRQLHVKATFIEDAKTEALTEAQKNELDDTP